MPLKKNKYLKIVEKLRKKKKILHTKCCHRNSFSTQTLEIKPKGKKANRNKKKKLKKV